MKDHAVAVHIWMCVSWSHCVCKYIYMLYIDLRPGQTCHSKVMRRKEVTHSDGSYERKSRRRIWLTKWDKVKVHDTLIDWCTGREWPLNCVTVIIIIVHKYTNYYWNPFIILIKHELSKRTIVYYAIFHQFIIISLPNSLP